MTGINYRESARLLRQHLGHSPEVFAERLNLSKCAYLAYERGHRGSRGWTNLIYPLLDETGVSLDWLFKGRSNLTGVRDDNRPLFIAAPANRPTAYADPGQVADILERVWLDGKMEEYIAGLRALSVAKETQRKRASVKADGNVLTVDFIGASCAR